MWCSGCLWTTEETPIRTGRGVAGRLSIAACLPTLERVEKDHESRGSATVAQGSARVAGGGNRMALPEREGMDFDVVIVGAGPAGLAAAIRLKQLSAETGNEISVVVVEKGSEVGAHILSGAVIDPNGLDALVPDWREDPDRPLKTAVDRDEFMFLTKNSGVTMPNMFFPKLMSNHGNFVGSLSNVTKFLGRKAEEIGVEIYPGFPASEVLYDDRGAAVGIATGDLGIGKSGEPRDDYTRGMELRGKYTIFGEGARGSLTKTLVDRFKLNADRDHQKYGLGGKG